MAIKEVDLGNVVGPQGPKGDSNVFSSTVVSGVSWDSFDPNKFNSVFGNNWTNVVKEYYCRANVSDDKSGLVSSLGWGGSYGIHIKVWLESYIIIEIYDSSGKSPHMCWDVNVIPGSPINLSSRFEPWRGPQGERGPGTNHNLLRNWYLKPVYHGSSGARKMVLPINQRGKENYTGPNDGYTVDGWYMGGFGTVEITRDGLKLRRTGSYFTLNQRLELEESFFGKKITLSILGKGSLKATIYADGYRGTAAINSDVVTLSAVTTTLQANVSSFYISLIANDDEPFVLSAVKLELGDIQTLAYQDGSGSWALNDPPPDPGLELLKCQRYYIRFSNRKDMARTGDILLASKFGQSSEKVRLYVPTPVKMRANPTPTISGVFDCRAEGEMSNARNAVIGENGVELLVTFSEAQEMESEYMYVAAPYEDNAYLELNAEL